LHSHQSPCTIPQPFETKIHNVKEGTIMLLKRWVLA